MYANTDEGSSALWVCDEKGEVVENISYSLSDRAPILEQINEHYGTSFTGWSDNEIGLSIGDTVPSWAEYEKIEMPIQKIAVDVAPDEKTLLIVGSIKNGVCTLMSNGNNTLIADTSGIVQGYTGPPISSSSYIMSLMDKHSLNVTSISEDIVSLEIGAEIPSWSSYIQYIE